MNKKELLDQLTKEDQDCPAICDHCEYMAFCINLQTIMTEKLSTVKDLYRKLKEEERRRGINV